MSILDVILVLIFLLILLVFLWLIFRIRVLDVFFRRWFFLRQIKIIYILVVMEIVLVYVIYLRLSGNGAVSSLPIFQQGAGLTGGGMSQTQSTGDYAKDVENCNTLLYKSPSNSIYCYIAINAELGDGVGVPGAGVSYEPTVKRAEKLFEQRYQATLASYREQEESAGSQPGWEQGTQTEEVGTGGVKLIINKHANIKRSSGFVYEYSGEAHLLQGRCVLEISGGALTRTGDREGDLSRMKEAVLTYMNKLSGEFDKYCRDSR